MSTQDKFYFDDFFNYCEMEAMGDKDISNCIVACECCGEKKVSEEIFLIVNPNYNFACSNCIEKFDFKLFEMPF